MVQLIAMAAIGGVAYVAYSSFKKHMAAIKAEELERNKEPTVLGQLEKDPVTGKYRVKK